MTTQKQAGPILVVTVSRFASQFDTQALHDQLEQRGVPFVFVHSEGFDFEWKAPGTEWIDAGESQPDEYQPVLTYSCMPGLSWYSVASHSEHGGWRNTHDSEDDVKFWRALPEQPQSA